jgi:hypothetical protein
MCAVNDKGPSELHAESVRSTEHRYRVASLKGRREEDADTCTFHFPISSVDFDEIWYWKMLVLYVFGVY